jgi:hypothetical protein
MRDATCVPAIHEHRGRDGMAHGLYGTTLNTVPQPLF